MQLRAILEHRFAPGRSGGVGSEDAELPHGQAVVDQRLRDPRCARAAIGPPEGVQHSSPDRGSNREGHDQGAGQVVGDDQADDDQDGDPNLAGPTPTRHDKGAEHDERCGPDGDAQRSRGRRHRDAVACGQLGDDRLGGTAVDEVQDEGHRTDREDVGDEHVAEQPETLRDEGDEHDGPDDDEAQPFERPVDDPLDRAGQPVEKPDGIAFESHDRILDEEHHHDQRCSDDGKDAHPEQVDGRALVPEQFLFGRGSAARVHGGGGGRLRSRH